MVRCLALLLLLAGAGANAQTPAPFPAPLPEPADKAQAINLATALQLASVRPLDIALATERVRQADARFQQAKVLWLPTVYLGIDYLRHDGRIQDIVGQVFPTSRSHLFGGVGPSMVFAATDAIFAPLSRQQVLMAREASLQAARNDSLMSVAEAFFNVQQARGDLAGAIYTAQQAGELLARTEKLAESLVPKVEVARTRAELARRRQLVHQARKRWRTASAELARLLRLDPSCLVEPIEAPDLQITLIDPTRELCDLLPVALMNRPELAAHQALVQASLDQLQQEKWRPLLPSVMVRGATTNPAGTLGMGVFGGGVNGFIGHTGYRGDVDVQVVWELKNLGLGNRALVRERRSQVSQANLEYFKTHDRIAAEVATAHAELRAAHARLGDAELGLKDSLESLKLNYEGLRQTKQAGRVILLVVRPQEAVAALQALANAYSDYYGAIADYDRAQFRLYRALGTPAQDLSDKVLADQGQSDVIVSPARP